MQINIYVSEFTEYIISKNKMIWELSNRKSHDFVYGKYNTIVFGKDKELFETRKYNKQKWYNHIMIYMQSLMQKDN